MSWITSWWYGPSSSASTALLPQTAAAANAAESSSGILTDADVKELLEADQKRAESSTPVKKESPKLDVDIAQLASVSPKDEQDAADLSPVLVTAEKADEVAAQFQEQAAAVAQKEEKQEVDFFTSLSSVKSREEYVRAIREQNQLWGRITVGDGSLEIINEILLKSVPKGTLKYLGIEPAEEASPVSADASEESPKGQKSPALDAQPLDSDHEDFPTLAASKPSILKGVKEEYVQSQSEKLGKGVADKLLPGEELSEICLNSKPILRRGSMRQKNKQQARIKDVYEQIRTAMGDKQDNSMAAVQVLKLCNPSVVEPLVTEAAEKLGHASLGIALFRGSRQRRPKINIETLHHEGSVAEGKGEGSRVAPKQAKDLSFVKISYSSLYLMRVKEEATVTKIQVKRVLTIPAQELATGILTKSTVEDLIEVAE